MRSNQFKIEVKEARNGLPIPVINGIHLHSIYNPTKEAETFATSHEEHLMRNSNILVLGLGFGYHIHELDLVLKKYHNNRKIIVIEPNEELVKLFNSRFEYDTGRVLIKTGEDISSYYKNEDVVNFLIQRPYIIKHDTSFNLQLNFYKAFLSYTAPTRINQYLDLMNVQTRGLFDNNTDLTLEQYIKNVSQKKNQVSRHDYILLALNEIKNRKYTR
jgi:hypothetical protein